MQVAAALRQEFGAAITGASPGRSLPKFDGSAVLPAWRDRAVSVAAVARFLLERLDYTVTWSP